jgi:hypothetical protein
LALKSILCQPTGELITIWISQQQAGVSFSGTIPYPAQQEYHLQELNNADQNWECVAQAQSKFNRHKQGQCHVAQTQWFWWQKAIDKLPCGGGPCQEMFEVAVRYTDKQEYHFLELFCTLTSRSIIFINSTTLIKPGVVWHKPLSKFNYRQQEQCCVTQTHQFWRQEEMGTLTSAELTLSRGVQGGEPV